MSDANPKGRGTGAARGAWALARRLGLGDAVLFFYLAAFAREYFWAVESNALAWVLTLVASALALWLYVRGRGDADGPTPRAFWLIVALPLLFVYALRVPFPDVSFDVLNYRLIFGDRALAGPLFVPGDFFPTPAPYNPAPDIVTGIFRHTLGYRLGTLPNLLAFVWAGQIVERILRPYVRGVRLRCAGVLLVVLSEHALFEINNYMVDLLAVPLILEAVRLALRDDMRARRDAPRIALLLGASVAFKLTNLSAAAAVLLVYSYRLIFKERPAIKEMAVALALSAVAFAAPVIPFAVYIYAQTGNPVFPLANTYFASPYWHTRGGWDQRWGATGLWETLAWPVLSAFRHERLSELVVYSNRIPLAFVAALSGLVFVRRDARARLLCVVFILAALLWSASLGYIRYGLHLELLGGAVVVALAALAARAEWRLPRAAGLGAAYALCLALAAQALAACWFVSQNEWGGRPTLVKTPRSYFREAKFLLRDRDIARFLPDAERAALAQVGVWVESGMKSSGVESVLRPGLPVVNVRAQEYFETRESAKTFISALDAAGDKKLYSLCFAEDLKTAQRAIESRGLKVGRKTPFTLPFYSHENRIQMYLLEVERASGGGGVEAVGAQLPEGSYRAEISAADAPSVFKRGEKRALRLRVRNAGQAAWPARGTKDGRYRVSLGDRWLDAGGKNVVNDLDARTDLPRDLGPGEEVELTLAVTAPKQPGDYVLEIDMVHESVTWFYEKGSRTLRLNVRVE
jgi:hypothetical protein